MLPKTKTLELDGWVLWDKQKKRLLMEEVFRSPGEAMCHAGLATDHEVAALPATTTVEVPDEV